VHHLEGLVGKYLFHEINSTIRQFDNSTMKSNEQIEEFVCQSKD